MWENWFSHYTNFTSFTIDPSDHEKSYAPKNEYYLSHLASGFALAITES